MMGSGLLLINASDPAAHGRIQGFTQVGFGRIVASKKEVPILLVNTCMV
jgi:hypothetical protein